MLINKKTIERSIILTILFSSSAFAGKTEDIIGKYKCYEIKDFPSQTSCNIRMLAANPGMEKDHAYLKQFSLDHSLEISERSKASKCSQDEMFSSSMNACLSPEKWDKTIEGAKTFISLYQCKTKVPDLQKDSAIDKEKYDKMVRNLYADCKNQIPKLNKDKTRLDNKADLIMVLLQYCPKTAKYVDEKLEVAIFNAKNTNSLIVYYRHQCLIEKSNCEDLSDVQCPATREKCFQYLQNAAHTDWRKVCEKESINNNLPSKQPFIPTKDKSIEIPKAGSQK